MNDDLSKSLISDKAKAKFNDQKQILKLLADGKTPQQLVEFSDELMAKMYHVAYLLFEKKRYQDAADAFLFLSTLNSQNHDYWLGLGMATQMCHLYEEAIDAYELAALCDIASPVPYFYLAKCLFAIHDRKNALEALELAIETAGDQEEFAELKNQAEHAKEVLLKDEQA